MFSFANCLLISFTTCYFFTFLIFVQHEESTLVIVASCISSIGWIFITLCKIYHSYKIAHIQDVKNDNNVEENIENQNIEEPMNPYFDLQQLNKSNSIFQKYYKYKTNYQNCQFYGFCILLTASWISLFIFLDCNNTYCENWSSPLKIQTYLSILLFLPLLYSIVRSIIKEYY